MNYEQEVENDIIRGDTWDGIEFTITKAGTDYNGAIVKIQYRAFPDGPIFLSQVVVPTISTFNQIVFRVALTAAESALFNSKKVYADTEITTYYGDRRTPILLKFNVIKDITISE